jgi:hypothetical protein
MGPILPDGEGALGHLREAETILTQRHDLPPQEREEVLKCVRAAQHLLKQVIFRSEASQDSNAGAKKKVSPVKCCVVT